MLVSGTHFLPDTDPFQLGWKTLAVNLSDLAAMGAKPRWVTLAGSLPTADERWIAAFADGLFACVGRYGVDLVGGDTTRGPLSITVTAHGLVPHGAALRRSGARVGDDIWVSGTLGDAAAGLALLQRSSPERIGAVERAQLLARLHRPTPRIALGIALRGIASACIDVSDGLTADLDHLSRASDVGAELELAALPTSEALRALDPSMREAFQLGGGDDYELCFTAPTKHSDRIRAAAASTDTRVKCIGDIHGGGGLRVRSADRMLREIKPVGYEHFTRDPASGSRKS
jgi:thiamine-monophosphate kinase